MQINAINTVNFESAKNRYRKQHKHQQQNAERLNQGIDLNDMPAYKPVRKSNKFRNTTMALAAATAMSASTGALMNSCTVGDDEFNINIDSNTDINANIKLYPITPPKPDTIYIRDTINNIVIDTVVVKDTVLVKEDFDSEPIDTINKNIDSLDIDTIGKGDIPYMITAYDPWNLAAHKLKLDIDASSKKEMVYVDEIKNYYEDKNNPKTQFRRIKFSVDKGRGLTVKRELPISDNGVKPQGEWGWKEDSKLIQTNLPGKIRIAKYNSNGSLEEVGNYKRGDKASSVFFNFILDNGEIGTHRFEQMKAFYCDPSAEANFGKPYVEKEEN